jgi:hypothetical protein
MFQSRVIQINMVIPIRVSKQNGGNSGAQRSWLNVNVTCGDAENCWYNVVK